VAVNAHLHILQSAVTIKKRFKFKVLNELTFLPKYLFVLLILCATCKREKKKIRMSGGKRKNSNKIKK
jgi:hypothetical protein